MFPVLSEMGELLTEGTRKWTGAAYTVETDIEKLVDLMIERIEREENSIRNLICCDLKKCNKKVDDVK